MVTLHPSNLPCMNMGKAGGEPAFVLIPEPSEQQCGDGTRWDVLKSS